MPKYMRGTKSQQAKLDKAQSQLDEGTKPQPPVMTQKLRNICDSCSAPGVLRYHGSHTCTLWVCAECDEIFHRIAKWHDDAQNLPDIGSGYDWTCGMISDDAFFAS